MGTALTVVKAGGGVLWGLIRWSLRHWLWIGLTAGWAPGLWVVAERPDLAVALVLAAWVAPGLVCVAWSRWWPWSWERVVAGPLRRRSWRTWARDAWPRLSRECGLSTSRQVQVKSRWNGEVSTQTRWTHARLRSVRTDGYVMTLTVQVRTGQTAHDVTKIAKAIAAAAGAHSVTARVATPSTARVELVMADHLSGVQHSPDPR